MRRAGLPPGHERREPVLRRIERAAQELNPFLLLIVIGLAILDGSVYMALRLAQMHH